MYVQAYTKKIRKAAKTRRNPDSRPGATTPVNALLRSRKRLASSPPRIAPVNSLACLAESSQVEDRVASVSLATATATPQVQIVYKQCCSKPPGPVLPEQTLLADEAQELARRL